MGGLAERSCPDDRRAGAGAIPNSPTGYRERQANRRPRAGRRATSPSACWHCASRWPPTSREVVAAIQDILDIERIGDYAKNIAKRALQLNQSSRCARWTSIPGWGISPSRSSRMLDAYVEKDADRRSRSGAGTRKSTMYTWRCSASF